jgi:glycosyltransferase involved in cell wall biosynthesis
VGRLEGALTPRLGDLRPQYPSRQLAVPFWYLRERVPDPPPTIAMVTPSLNQGRFVARAAESVLGQGYPRLEYVVRDGGSDDDTLERLERFRPRLAGLESGPDSGQGAAINAGFAATSGEIMGWLNADDILLPGSLAFVARFFVTHPSVDVLYGDRVVIDEWDRDVGIWALPRHRLEALRWVDFIPQECTFWRRSIWDRCGPLDEELRYALDWDLLRRFEADGAEFSHRRRLLGGFRRHSDQKTSYDAYEPVPKPVLEELMWMQQRWNGVAISEVEAFMRAQPSRLRAIPARLAYRALDRVPFPRASVHFAP